MKPETGDKVRLKTRSRFGARGIIEAYVESAVKQINHRVKGTEKFWNEAGAEQLLQLRADYLSDGNIMEAYWKRREANETGQNRYRCA